MENERYAELRLYYGLCSSDGCGEGRFSPEKKDQWSVSRLTRAIKTIERYFQPDYDWGFNLGSWEHIVHDETEAKTLIQFAEKNIRGASGLIEPVESMHGRIAFWRKIRFAGWTEEQREELVQELKKIRLCSER